MDSPPLENGAVAVDGNSIAAIGKIEDLAWLDDGPVIDLGDVALFPGLINAHCHLDYTMMRYAIAPPKSFTAWVQRINALKRSLDSDDYLAAIQKGFRELQKWGTTSVCNIEAFPELMPGMPEPPIRTWWFYEMIDIRHRITTNDVVAGALSFFHNRPHSLSRFGLSPHAPYTASRPLFELANACANTMTMLLTTHVAESREEAEMFREGSGPLYEFMASLGRPMSDCGKGSAFSQLWNCGAINANWLLAHMNELSESDFALLANQPRGNTPHIVHCPGSHAYFGHSPFQFRRLHSLGVNISVGTDSLASTNSLSLFDELRRLEKEEPWLTPHQLLRTITLNPALALRRKGRLGRIGPGALADLIALPVSGKLETIYEEIVHFHEPIRWMMIDGKQITS
ncbi:amidohydrolase family protein [Verrucomicrobiota bacterium sgz303538]